MSTAAKQKKANEVLSGEQIWTRYFWIEVNHFRTRSLESMRLYGTRISGDERLDKNIDKRTVRRQATIDEMFEIYRGGNKVTLINYDDSATVYRIIRDHLIVWAEYMSRGVHTNPEVMKDLVELDAFASVVHDKAVAVFTQEERNMVKRDGFMNVQMLNFGNILNRAKVDKPVKEIMPGVEVSRASDEPEKKPGRKHHSFAEIFNTELNNIIGWQGDK